MSLGTLTIDIAANLARLESDLGKANRISQKFAEDQARRYQRIGKVIGAAIATVSVGAFANWIQQSIDAADEAGKAAAAIGVTVEAYQGLTFAADLAGVAQEQLTGALGKFNKTISAAGQGGKKQAQAFADLGLSVRDANGELKSADALLLEVADKFAGYEDGAAKAAIAQDLFGKSGTKLIPLLNSGRDGITELTEQAQRLGLVMSAESAAKAEQFNDQITVLQGVSRGAANQIAAELLPALTDVSGLMIDLAEDSGTASTAADILGGVLKGLATVALGVGGAFSAAATGWGAFAATAAAALRGDFKGALEIAKMGAADIESSYEKTFERIKKLWSGDYRKAGEDAAATAGLLRETLKRTNNETDKAAEAAQKQVDAIGQQVEALQLQAATLGMTSAESTLYKLALDGATDSQLKSAKAALDSVAAYEKSQEAAKAAAERWKAIQQVQESTLSDNSRALLDYQKKVETLREGLINKDINQATYDAEIGALDKQLEETQNKANETKDALSVFADEAARNMQGAFADFLFDPFAGGLDGMLDGFGKMLQRMIAEAAAAQLMEDLLGKVGKSGDREGGLLSGLAGMFGGAAGASSGGGGWLAALGGLFGGAKAVGGPVESGKFYEVGENNRPELFTSNGREWLIPGNSGSVKPLNGGGARTQVFNINTPDADSFRASQRQIARRAKQDLGKS